MMLKFNIFCGFDIDQQIHTRQLTPFTTNIIHLWPMHATGLQGVCYQYMILVIKDLRSWINMYNGVKRQEHDLHIHYYGNLVLHNSLAQKAWTRSVGCIADLLCMALLPPTHYTLQTVEHRMKLVCYTTPCAAVTGTCSSKVFPAYETTILSVQ